MFVNLTKKSPTRRFLTLLAKWDDFRQMKWLNEVKYPERLLEEIEFCLEV